MNKETRQDKLSKDKLKACRHNRAHLFSILDKTIELAQSAQKVKKSKQMSLFEIINEESDLEE